MITVKTSTFIPGTDNLRQLVQWVGACIETRKQRHDLRGLSFGTLEDIGISESAARIESAKPFWA
jgi:uncharacterized protein YjiS (DUF1127 family)